MAPFLGTFRHQKLLQESLGAACAPRGSTRSPKLAFVSFFDEFISFFDDFWKVFSYFKIIIVVVGMSFSQPNLLLTFVCLLLAPRSPPISEYDHMFSAFRSPCSYRYIYIYIYIYICV